MEVQTMLPVRMITRSGSLSPFVEMERWIEDVFGRMSENDPQCGVAVYPRADVLETEDAFIIEAEIPGANIKDIKIEFANNVLTLSGEKKSEKRDGTKGYHRMERSYGAFSRSFTTPATVDEKRISAAFTDGVLRVTMPKREESRPRLIEVQEG
jgi:HSP20 family protein